MKLVLLLAKYILLLQFYFYRNLLKSKKYVFSLEVINIFAIRLQTF